MSKNSPSKQYSIQEQPDAVLIQQQSLKKAIEPSKWAILVHGVNSVARCDKKLKDGQMEIGANRFRIPFTFCVSMGMKGIQMLIGCNFIRSMKGGLQIEGSEVTFYKNVTTIQTGTGTDWSNAAIPELDLDQHEYRAIREMEFLHIE